MTFTVLANDNHCLLKKLTLETDRRAIMTHHVDYLVLGLGGMGSSALYHLSKRGLNVLGIEQFGAAHDRGSSHGETRIIRKAYFEHPNYIPLLQRAYELWHDLEQTSGKTLFNRCGLMVAGPAEGA
ncbi:MAG: FAD-dependent oxidoreductase, partial [Planctomycetaceae bacterium]|nr:FAD-dependent oxidoreductase [Planctomycetaceae bacterium]